MSFLDMSLDRSFHYVLGTLSSFALPSDNSVDVALI